jgi:predicted ATPase
VEKIVSTSDCNPFFIENIVQNMIESGVLVEAVDGTYFLSKDIKNINIPSSIQNIILARLNSLLFEEQVVCKTASVIGRSFLSDILRAMVPEGISEYIFMNALENFETHNLILPRKSEERVLLQAHHHSGRRL